MIRGEINIYDPLVATTTFPSPLSLNLQVITAHFKPERCITIAIDENGYLNFTVGDNVVYSKTAVTTVAEKAAGTFVTPE
jgi:hypothetical protein